MATVQDLVIAVGTPFRDNLRSTTTASAGAGAKNQFIDSRRIGSTDNVWVGCDVLFLDRTGMTAVMPAKVIAFTALTGTFTIDQNWNAANGVPSGTRYVLMNLRGRGKPYQQRLDALELAINALSQEGTDAEVLVAGGAVMGTYTYTIPAGLDLVHTVLLRSQVGSTDWWQVEIPPAKWELLPGRKIFLNNRKLGSRAMDIVLWGVLYTAFDGSVLTNSYNVQTDEVVSLVAEIMTMSGDGQGDGALSARLQQERLRFEGDYAYPSAQRIKP